MVSKYFLRGLGILACLFSTVFILSSCGPDYAGRNFVLSQKRDHRLIGSWKSVRPPEDNTILIKEYTSNGEVRKYDNGKLFFLKYYFYTKDNVLYVFDLGDGFKRSSRTWEYEYRFSEDEKILYTKEVGGSMEDQWERVVDSPSE